MSKQPAVYIMASKRNGTLYTGVTSNLVQRLYQHKEHLMKKCFTAQYGCTLLAYYEFHSSIYSAISREKQIKGGSRKKKLKLNEAMNPQWMDLYDQIR